MSKVEFIWHCADEGESEFISGQIDLDPEFSQVVSDNFFELLDDKPTSPWIKVSDQEPPKDVDVFWVRRWIGGKYKYYQFGWCEKVSFIVDINNLHNELLATDEWMLPPE